MNKPRIKRKYEEAWEQLKASGILKLKVTRYYVPQVKRMVSKEKDMDDMWKIDNTHNPQTLSFEYSDFEMTLTIKLKGKFNL